MNPCRRSRALLFAIIATAVSCRHRAPEPDRISVTESIPATGCPPLSRIAGFISLREGALMTEWLTPYPAPGGGGGGGAAGRGGRPAGAPAPAARGATGPPAGRGRAAAGGAGRAAAA